MTKPFIQQLDELMQKDRQKFSLSATKIGQDLVLQIAPDVNGTGKIVDITIPAQDINSEDIDVMVMCEVFNVMAAPAKAEMASSVTETELEEEEEKEETDENPDKVEPAKNANKGKRASAKRGKVTTEQPALNLEEKPEAPEKTEISNIETPVQKIETPVEEPQLVVEETKAQEEPTPDVPAVEEPQQDKETTGQQTMSPQELKKLADDKFNSRDYTGSLELYEKCLELDPENSELQQLAKKAKQWVEAVARLKKS